MAFSDFRYPDVIEELGLSESTEKLYQNVVPVPPTEILRGALEINVRLATTAHSEASRSTWMVGPILADFWGRYDARISLYAGIELRGDDEAGLRRRGNLLLHLEHVEREARHA